LLGEPSIGKSWTLLEASAEVQKSLTAGERLMFFDLRAVGDEGRLMTKLFDSEIFTAWREVDWILPCFSTVWTNVCCGTALSFRP
jgi:hypothetical protein